jgi:hypothetical protein
MEPEGSSPSSQELSICTYPEPDKSSPQHSNHISKFLCLGPLSKKSRQDNITHKHANTADWGESQNKVYLDPKLEPDLNM